MAENSDTEKLNAGDKQDDADGRGPAVGRTAPYGLPHDDDHDADDGDEREQDAEKRADRQRHRRKGHNALQRVFEQLPERPFRFAGDALDVFIFDPARFVADPSEDPFCKTVVFADRQHAVDHLTCHQPEIPRAFDQLGFGDFVHQPVKAYSSGMFARLAFAVAISIEPDVLIIDEALSVGDVFFQNKCYRKFEELRSKGITILFVSHDIGAVKQLCSRVLWLDHGNCKMIGESVEVCNEYMNHILSKRTEEYNREIHNLQDENFAVKKRFDLESFPEIQYTNESILNASVKILSAFVTDSNGERVSACHAGETYTLSIIFHSDNEIRNCIAGFVMETIKGLWIINCNSISCGNKQPFQVCAQSMNRVDFEFEMPQIVNGDYVIGVAISEGNQLNFKVLTWLYGVLYLQITNVGNNDGILRLNADVSIYEREDNYE